MFRLRVLPRLEETQVLDLAARPRQLEETEEARVEMVVPKVVETARVRGTSREVPADQDIVQ
jgi:hypothetical protein